MPPKKDPKAQQQPQKQPQPEPQPYELVGYGKFQYLNGVVYEGNWKTIKSQKMKHGFGKLIIPSTGDTLVQCYQGDWFQDKMQGYGSYSYPDGSIYRGQWRNGKQEGRGQFQFANGTRYVGSWKEHCMHGAGEYTDHLGRKWVGEYRDGVFDSRKQRDLVKLIEIGKRMQELKKEVLGAAARLLELIQDKSQDTYKINSFFLRNEESNRFVRRKFAKYEDFTIEKWLQFLSSLKVQSFTVLTDRKESKVLSLDELIAEQLQGVGQIVEAHTDGAYQAAFLCIDSDQWVIAAVRNTKQ